MKNKTSNSCFFLVEIAFSLNSDLRGFVIFDWLICVSITQLASIPIQCLIPADTTIFIQKLAFEFHRLSFISEYYSVREGGKILTDKVNNFLRVYHGQADRGRAENIIIKGHSDSICKQSSKKKKKKNRIIQ